MTKAAMATAAHRTFTLLTQAQRANHLASTIMVRLQAQTDGNTRPAAATKSFTILRPTQMVSTAIVNGAANCKQCHRRLNRVCESPNPGLSCRGQRGDSMVHAFVWGGVEWEEAGDDRLGYDPCRLPAVNLALTR
jgi:hypothetical protein